MCVYYYHVIITFCYKVRKIQKEKLKKLVIVQAFNWLSRHVVRDGTMLKKRGAMAPPKFF